MFRILSLTIFMALPAYAEFCEEDVAFEVGPVSGEIEKGPFHVGHTSGFRKTGSKFTFIYCIESLHDSSWVFFTWNGPKPDMLIEGHLSKKPRNGRRIAVESWRDAQGPDSDEDRTLVLRLEDDNDPENFNVPTVFEDASATTAPRLRPVQDQSVLDLSTAGNFIRSIRNDPFATNQGQGVFSLSAGVEFDLPSDADALAEYPENFRDLDTEDFARVRVSVAARYDLETLDVSLRSFVGFANDLPAPTDLQALFDGITVGFEDIRTDAVGLESVELVGFGEAEPSPTGRFFGVAREQPLGSLADFAETEIPPQRATLPVTVRLNERLLYRFNLDVVGLPARL